MVLTLVTNLFLNSLSGQLSIIQIQDVDPKDCSSFYYIFHRACVQRKQETCKLLKKYIICIYIYVGFFALLSICHEHFFFFKCPISGSKQFHVFVNSIQYSTLTEHFHVFVYKCQTTYCKTLSIQPFFTIFTAFLIFKFQCNFIKNRYILNCIFLFSTYVKTC